MANTITGTSTSDQVYGEGAFNKLFDTVYTFTGTVSDQDAVAATDVGFFDVTVTGVSLGDIVLGVSFSVDLEDADQEVQATAAVSAADTVSIYLGAGATNAFDADTLNTATVKIIVGSPTW